MGVTSDILQALGNVHAAKELLNMLVKIGSVAGRLYLRILALTLSIPGALLEGRDLIIFSTSASVTNWKLKAARLTIVFVHVLAAVASLRSTTVVKIVL